MHYHWGEGLLMQAFIFNWRGHRRAARALEAQVGAILPVTVISSEPPHADDGSSWVHLDDTAYFSAQWNRAVELFDDGDVFFHMQADASCTRLDELILAASSCFSRLPVGVYEPNIDFTECQYDPTQLRAVGPGLYEVPQTDCTCWFIAADVLRSLPRVDLSVNTYGWGICGAIAAITRSLGKICVRDYNFTVQHPRHRGYSSELAAQQRLAYMRSLDRDIAKLMPGFDNSGRADDK